MMMDRLLHLSILLILSFEALLTVLMSAGCSHAQRVTYSGSIQFATGNYFFTETTSSFYFSNGLVLEGDRLSIGCNIPLITQNTPWISYSGSGHIPTGGTQHGSINHGSGKNSNSKHSRRIALPDTISFSQTQFGDPSVTGTITVLNGMTVIKVNSQIKFPITDPDKGFGTGAWDFGTGVAITWRFTDLIITADGTYWIFGDMPDLELQNAISYGLGIGKAFRSTNWLVMASFSGFSEIIDNVDSPKYFGIGLGHFINQRIGINSSINYGITESVPDLSFGLGWNINL